MKTGPGGDPAYRRTMDKHNYWIDTNSGNESSGFSFGLDGDNGIYLAVGLFAAVMSGTLLWSLLGVSLTYAFLPGAVIMALAIWYVIALKQGKAKGYDGDYFDHIINGAGISFNPAIQPRDQEDK